jgi:hypothetical protein
LPLGFLLPASPFLMQGYRRTIKAAACPICEFQTSPPHDGRTHRKQKKKGPFSAPELKEKGLVKV